MLVVTQPQRQSQSHLHYLSRPQRTSEQSFCPVTKVAVSEPPVLPREAIPASHVVRTELVSASRVMPTESSPGVSNLFYTAYRLQFGKNLADPWVGGVG